MRWTCAALVAAVMGMAAPAGAMVVHCPSGVAVIADSPADAPCADECAEWRISPSEREPGVEEAVCAETVGARAEREREQNIVAVQLWLSVVLFLGSVAVYFVPTFVAYARSHHNRGAILLTNLLLGWTGIGWIAALIWAATAVRPETA